MSRLLGAAARQRELSLLLVLWLMVGLVAIRAPQVLSVRQPDRRLGARRDHRDRRRRRGDGRDHPERRPVGRGDIGLVAFTVAGVLEPTLLPMPAAWAFGIGLGLVLGMINGIVVAVFRVPSIVATLGTLSVYRGIDFLLAGGKQVTADRAAARLHERGARDGRRHPDLRARRGRDRGCCSLVLRQTTLRALGLCGRQQPRGGGDPRHPDRTRDVRRVLGVRPPGWVAGVLWGILFGTINATAATGVTLQVVAAVVVGGVNIFGGSGTVVGAALGALFLASSRTP